MKTMAFLLMGVLQPILPVRLGQNSVKYYQVVGNILTRQIRVTRYKLASIYEDGTIRLYPADFLGGHATEAYRVLNKELASYGVFVFSYLLGKSPSPEVLHGCKPSQLAFGIGEPLAHYNGSLYALRNSPVFQTYKTMEDIPM